MASETPTANKSVERGEDMTNTLESVHVFILNGEALARENVHALFEGRNYAWRAAIAALSASATAGWWALR